MRGVEVLHEHVGEPGIRRQSAEQLGESLEAARRSANGDHTNGAGAALDDRRRYDFFGPASGPAPLCGGGSPSLAETLQSPREGAASPEAPRSPTGGPCRKPGGLLATPSKYGLCRALRQTLRAPSANIGEPLDRGRQ